MGRINWYILKIHKRIEIEKGFARQYDYTIKM